jgi:hypothetical protein
VRSGNGCIAKLRPRWGLRVGYKVLLILLAMELSSRTRNRQECYRTSTDCIGDSGNAVEWNRTWWNVGEGTIVVPVDASRRSLMEPPGNAWKGREVEGLRPLRVAE